MTLRRTVTASIRPSPLGEKNGELIEAALMTGGTLSVMNLALRTAYSSVRVPS